MGNCQISRRPTISPGTAPPGKGSRDIVVRSLTRRSTRGWLTLGALRFPCALGRSGCQYLKAEGDGATPIGSWKLRAVRYRADQGQRPRIGQGNLSTRAIRATDGWCDARGDRNYNRAVARPYPASSETLWRDDRVYDLIVVLDHNERPRVQGGGSAIFMHVARPRKPTQVALSQFAPTQFAPTEGCVALPLQQLRRLLAAIRRGTRLRIIG